MGGGFVQYNILGMMSKLFKLINSDLSLVLIRGIKILLLKLILTA